MATALTTIQPILAAFEIYPLGNAPITIATRLGFRVPQSMPP